MWLFFHVFATPYLHLANQTKLLFIWCLLTPNKFFISNTTIDQNANQ
jgi:hypothetical protein